MKVALTSSTTTHTTCVKWMPDHTGLTGFVVLLNQLWFYGHWFVPTLDKYIFEERLFDRSHGLWMIQGKKPFMCRYGLTCDETLPSSQVLNGLRARNHRVLSWMKRLSGQ